MLDGGTILKLKAEKNPVHSLLFLSVRRASAGSLQRWLFQVRPVPGCLQDTPGLRRPRRSCAGYLSDSDGDDEERYEGSQNSGAVQVPAPVSL